MERMSESGLPIEPVYDEEQLTNFRPEEKLGMPGAYRYIRGVYPTMYAKRPWAMRQYAGHADEFGAADPRSQVRFQTQTAGVQLAAQQPGVNVVRVTVQAGRRTLTNRPKHLGLPN